MGLIWLDLYLCNLWFLCLLALSLGNFTFAFTVVCGLQLRVTFVCLWFVLILVNGLRGFGCFRLLRFS